jgi:DNA-binding GntR family transcriptional regulator
MTAEASNQGALRPNAAASGKRLAALVHDALKERLLEGEFAAGERLSPEALKTQFDVSKQPIMEALRRLSSVGLVEIIPQVGCRVPIYTPADVTDFFAMFGGMEGAVAGVAANRRTDAQIAELHRINDAIGNLADNSDPDSRAHGYRLRNRQFHAVIHEMAHSPVVADLSRRMWDMSDLLIATSGVPRPLASALSSRHRDHELIIDALHRRDPAAARQAMEEHIVGTVAIIRTEAGLA